MIESGPPSQPGILRERGQGDWTNYTPPRAVLASIAARHDPVPLQPESKLSDTEHGRAQASHIRHSQALARSEPASHRSDANGERGSTKPPGPPPKGPMGPPPPRTTQFTSSSGLKPPGPPPRPPPRMSSALVTVTDSGSGFREDFSFTAIPETRPMTLVAPKKPPGPPGMPEDQYVGASPSGEDTQGNAAVLEEGCVMLERGGVPEQGKD